MKPSNVNSPEPETLENQLTSWKPRTPSRSLKARILSRAASSAASSEEGPVLLPLWRLLAPAFAGTFVLIMALTPRNEQLSIATRARTDRFLEAVAGNQNYAAYLTGGLHILP